MKDLKNFCKLFNIYVPVDIHQEYYFDQLEQSGYRPEIKSLIKLYSEFEETVRDPHSHKMASMDRLIKFIKESDFYKYFNEDPTVTKELADYKIEGINQTGFHYQDPEKVFLSIDMSKANYQILKQYDKTGIIGQSWDHFLDLQEINPIYKHSKTFRQHTLGNLNPKRIQRHQAIVMDKLSKEIGFDNELISKSYDELIYLIPKMNSYPNFAYSDVVPYEFKQTIYTMEQIGKEKYIKKIYNPLGDEKHELKGVEGNMFYMYLKKYISCRETHWGMKYRPNEVEYDDRDLYFIDNKRLAKWIETL